MLYYLFAYLDELNVPGAGLFNYLTVRAAAAIITSMIISLLIGKRIIRLLQRRMIGELVRDLDLEGQYQKKGTPSMGGIIIILSILIPTLLFARLDNVYVILMLVTTLWLGFIGFVDDYIKIFRKKKEGLAGKFKILGQVILGLIVALTLYISDDAVIREITFINEQDTFGLARAIESSAQETAIEYTSVDIKSTKTTIPFIKNTEFDYSWLVPFVSKDKRQPWGWLVFVVAVIFIVTAVSNGANLTDGLDGLATGTSAIMVVTLGILAYVSGNIIYSNYLNIMYIPYSGELVIFAGSFIGAAIGFLWYNSYPAQVFMGDTGSLTIGGIIAVFAIIIRKELLIPILCGIFFAESLSVLIQVAWFKRTKRKYGAGRRVFLMAPLHHHFQKMGFPEPKIVTRFWIVAIILAVLSVVITLKVR
ncbi:MAG: phospho-N-acetylmuramoyl-pentapeptide-transferase [Marinilabiliaceae bacterium]|jgi:phospho-N-acetylmuramoyl-pentapeptide-transferase|nr:phospho-N-acetylmuramoyl-pentapeptide-transferase [Marinilabiliaceae bacterium]